MLHLMKYRLIQATREKSTMFWALAFPIILSVFFNLSLGKSAFEDAFKKMPVALAERPSGTRDENFEKFLETFDGDMLTLKKMSEEKALEQLGEGKVDGIFYGNKTLSVSSNGISSSVLKTLLDSYVRNEAMLKEIAQEHPERMEAAVKTLSEYKEMTEEVSAGGHSLDTSMSLFFALIAMTCLYGCFPGLQTMMENQANLSPLGARQCITPTHKLKRILSNFIVTYLVQFVDAILVLLFIKYILRVEFGTQMGGMVLVCLFGSLIGVSFGIIVGASGRMGEGVKVGILLSICMVLCFLGGLMSPDTKTYIELSMPVINRINPAAVISDAFYCLNVYDDKVRLVQCLATLAGMSAILVGTGFLIVRRERYESI